MRISFAASRLPCVFPNNLSGLSNLNGQSGRLWRRDDCQHDERVKSLSHEFGDADHPVEYTESQQCSLDTDQEIADDLCSQRRCLLWGHPTAEIRGTKVLYHRLKPFFSTQR